MNYPELRASIARAGLTARMVSQRMGISAQALYSKMQGITEFKSSEIKQLADILNLSMPDVNHIFFDSSVN